MTSSRIYLDVSEWRTVILSIWPWWTLWSDLNIEWDFSGNFSIFLNFSRGSHFFFPSLQVLFNRTWLIRRINRPGFNMISETSWLTELSVEVLPVLLLKPKPTNTLKVEENCLKPTIKYRAINIQLLIVFSVGKFV